jgi:hypothetical protein
MTEFEREKQIVTAIASRRQGKTGLSPECYLPHAWRIAGISDIGFRW